MGKRILGQNQLQEDITTDPPVGDVGIDMTLFLEASRPRWWLVTVAVTDAPGTLYMWGALPMGVPDDASDDIWGFHQDEYGTFPIGVIATSLPVGTYHFMIDGFGLYSRVYFQKSAGTMTVTLSEILEGGRGN